MLSLARISRTGSTVLLLAAAAGVLAQSSPPAASDAPTRRTVVDDMRERDRLLWERAVAKMEEMNDRARVALAENRFTDARQFADHALQTIESAKAYAEPADKYDAAKRICADLKQQVEDAAAAYETAQADQDRIEIEQRLAERKAIFERQRAEKIEQLFNTARQLRQEQRFGEAAQVLREVLYIDAANARARDQLEVMEDFDSVYTQKSLYTDYYRESRRSLVQTEEAKVPWDYNVLYPKNWQAIVAKRTSSGVLIPGSDEDRELNRVLEETMSDVRFNDTPLETVFDYLKDHKSVNISVDWENLQSVGVERDKPISVKLTDLPFGTILREVIHQAAGVDAQLGFRVSEGLIRVSTQERLDRDKVTLVYDIRDLLVNIPRFLNAPKFEPTSAMNEANALAVDGGGRVSGSLFRSSNEIDDDTVDTRNVGIGDPAIVQKLLDTIREQVAPDSWRETGGGNASIRELNGNLIVYNTSDAHRGIGDLLGQLRDARALQVALEARFLAVSNNFLQEIGVDLDFVLNQGSATFDPAFSAGQGGVPSPLTDPFTGAQVLVPRQFSQIGTTPNVPGFGIPLGNQPNVIQPYQQAGFVPTGTGVIPQFNNTTPIPIRQGSLGLSDPSRINTGVPGSWAQAASITPALSIAGSFLDNLQVDFLIRATEANQRSTLVQAPRLMLFNGQRANVSVGRVQQYVSGVRPQLAEGVVGFTPIVAAAFGGTTLDVEGTISADRKYVTVTIRTSQLRDPNFSRFEVQRGFGNSPSVFITLLDQETATINTTVSIPDGGTVLMGGVKRVGEVEIEAGVPILSKIPVLKRAFTNTSMVKDVQTLLILLKASIVIQKEAEQEAFPTMTTADAG
ncbi:MAG: type II secretion system protein GspD [Phycisphaerae bacterium]